MATKKETSARKSPLELVYAKFEGTIVARPIMIANKAFLAGLGLAANVQSDFADTFSKLAKDGEQVRKQYRSTLKDFRGDVVGQFKTTQKRVEKNVKSVVETVAKLSPVATQSDLDKLNRKLDKVLAEVAK